MLVLHKSLKPPKRALWVVIMAVQELASHSVMAVYTAVTECVLTVVILTVKVVVKVVVWGHAAEVALV